MTNTIKLTFIIIASLFNVTAFASLICPSVITCNYEKGSCDQSDEWLLANGSTQKPFIGSQHFNLFDIRAMKIDFPKNLYGKYQIKCWYTLDPNRPSGLIGISALANTLVGGSWVFTSYFDRSIAVCSSGTDPSNCTGE